MLWSKEIVKKGYRVLATTLTKKWLKILSSRKRDLKLDTCTPDIDTLERIEIIRDLEWSF